MKNMKHILRRRIKTVCLTKPNFNLESRDISFCLEPCISGDDQNFQSNITSLLFHKIARRSQVAAA